MAETQCEQSDVAPTYPVGVLRAGRANGLAFPARALQRAAPLFEGAPVFVDHPGLMDMGRAGGRSVRDLAGVLTDVRWEPTAGELRGRVRLLSAAGWVRDLVAEAGGRPFFGLSADLWVRREGEEVQAIRRVNSVDIVVYPAAGGRFLPAGSAGAQGERPRLAHTQQEGTSMTEERVQIASAQADQMTAGGAQGADAEPQAETQAQADAPAGADVAQQLLELRLANAGLPAVLADAVRGQVQSGAVGWDGLDALIERSRQRWGEAVAQASIRNLGTSPSLVDPLDRIELAFERLMGLPETAEHRGAPRLSGIREMYDLLTGDWERRGLFQPSRVTLANATTSTMAGVVANVLNKALLRAYEAREPWWRPIAYEEDFASLQDPRWISLGGFSDLDTVTEGNPYLEKTWDDAYETSPFVKKGNYLGLTLEMIDRDDVGAVRAIPRKLAHAAQRTLSSAVAALFSANAGVGPALADEKPLFDEDHGNLGSAALDDEAWWAVVTAMFQQAELHSSKRMGVRPRYCLVPLELEKTALGLFTSDYPPGAVTFEQNVLRNTAGVITVPEWTDADDWAAAADPGDLEGVCIGYRFGRAPEIFVADGETMGAMFTNDEMRIKVRFIYAVGVGNYRALYKQNVSGD